MYRTEPVVESVCCLICNSGKKSSSALHVLSMKKWLKSKTAHYSKFIGSSIPEASEEPVTITVEREDIFPENLPLFSVYIKKEAKKLETIYAIQILNHYIREVQAWNSWINNFRAIGMHYQVPVEILQDYQLGEQILLAHLD